MASTTLVLGDVLTMLILIRSATISGRGVTRPKPTTAPARRTSRQSRRQFARLEARHSADRTMSPLEQRFGAQGHKKHDGTHNFPYCVLCWFEKNWEKAGS